jgi:hypothetical protein
MPTEVAPAIPKAWATMDRAQLQALYDKRRLCVMAAKLQRGADDERTAHQLKAMDKLPADPREREERLDTYARAFEHLDQAKAECRDQALEPLVDGSMYELALRVADAGDRDAALCYVSGSFPTGTAMLRRPDLRQRFAINAQRLFERNVEAGDWRMVMLGMVAFQPDARWQWKLELPEHPLDTPDMNLTMTIAPKGDALRYYRMLKLASLGAALEPDENRAKASAMMAAYSGRSLTPAQRREADAWANRTFAQAFHGRGPGTRHFDSCN